MQEKETLTSAMLDEAPKLRIPTARAFLPFLKPARYKAIFGGRGGGKSHYFAEAMIERCVMRQTRAVCLREVQNSIRDSVRQLLLDKMDALGVSHMFDVVETEIRGPHNSLIIFRGMQHYTAQNIKSLEGYDIAWMAEAQSMAQRSLDILRPTIRKEGSELWFDWNPDSELDAVDMFFRGKHPPPDAIIRHVNFDDNPWFPDVLNQERLADLAADPAKYEHVWLGGYRQAATHSYYGALLAKAKVEGRIGRIPHDPALDVHAAFDLGVGKNMAIWFAQFSGKEIRLIDYLEGDDAAADEGLPWYGRKLREKPYTYAPLILPHDAKARDPLGNGKTREAALQTLGFKTRIVGRMNPEDRIELVKRTIPKMWIDGEHCADGLRLIRDYREDWDDKNRVARGPKHNHTSHAADALGHLVQAYEEPREPVKVRKPINRAGEQGWMR